MADAFRYDLIPAGCTVLCALSGGADSMYLLSRLDEGRERGGYALKAAHYDHHLRPTSGEEGEFVRRWCEGRGIPIILGGGDVAAAAGGKGVEETARAMRYAFLRETALREGCAVIATGHHAGDNAETILMNLIRGCGAGGLSGIPERRGELIRPMLEVERREILTYLTEHNIPHVEDESNGDTAYTRNKVRLELLPLLEELNPKAAQHICAAGKRAAEDHRALCARAEELLESAREREGGTAISAGLLAAAPRAVACRALRMLAPSAQAVHVEALLALCRGEDPSARLALPGLTARRVYGELVFTPAESPVPHRSPLVMGEQVWGGWRIACEEAVCPPRAYVSPAEFYLKTGVYTLRSRREGDGITLGARPHKTLKKLMIEGKVPAHLRPLVPVLADGGDAPAAVGGFGPHREALAAPGTVCLRIIMGKDE